MHLYFVVLTLLPQDQQNISDEISNIRHNRIIEYILNNIQPYSAFPEK